MPVNTVIAIGNCANCGKTMNIYNKRQKACSITCRTKMLRYKARYKDKVDLFPVLKCDAAE